MHVTIIAGTRPNFVKISPIIHAIKRFQSTDDRNLEYTLVHTGQHYDEKMSGSFFKDLNIPEPDVNLNVGSSSHSEQTAKIMIAFEEHLVNNPTDCVLVVGDVNSTMACAIVAKKLHLKLVHVEGGLRSNDRNMPEEINRLITDSITDYFFTTSRLADENLKNEGVAEDRVFLVGNTMIDSLVNSLERTNAPELPEKLIDGEYFLLTLHRPSNVDDRSKLNELLSNIHSFCQGFKIVFPVHPRTKSKIDNPEHYEHIIFTSPLPYLQFLHAMKHAKAVITDSGGIQEETTFLQTPCLTLRNNTERPETIEIGTNVLIGEDMKLLQESISQIIAGEWKAGQIPEFWDGKTSDRIVEHLARLLD